MNATPLPSRLYHFTDTARLPWILSSGELQPGRNKIGGFPDPDFIWATVDARDDLTSSAHRGDGYKSGRVLHVRFTLDASGFIPWSCVPRQFPQWKTGHVKRLEAAAKGRSLPSQWWCRASALPLDRCLAIETRSHADRRWLPVPDGLEVLHLPEECLGMIVGGQLFASQQVAGPMGSVGYAI